MAHREGILSAASLMVAGAAAEDAIRRARAMPSLRVGLHLTLVEDMPCLPAREIPALTGPDGRFCRDMAALGARMFFDPGARRQLGREIEAQVAAFARTGLAPDHLNAHKHFHLHPTIAGLAMRAARARGFRAIRVPVEPGAMIGAIETPGPGISHRVFGLGARLLGARARLAGFRTPDQVFGLAWSGAMTTSRIAALIARLPAGVSEIYTHPAMADVFEGAAPGYRYRDELAALVDREIVAGVKRAGIRLGGYSDLLAG